MSIKFIVRDLVSLTVNDGDEITIRDITSNTMTIRLEIHVVSDGVKQWRSDRFVNSMSVTSLDNF